MRLNFHSFFFSFHFSNEFNPSADFDLFIFDPHIGYALDARGYMYLGWFYAFMRRYRSFCCTIFCCSVHLAALSIGISGASCSWLHCSCIHQVTSCANFVLRLRWFCFLFCLSCCRDLCSTSSLFFRFLFHYVYTSVLWWCVRTRVKVCYSNEGYSPRSTVSGKRLHLRV